MGEVIVVTSGKGGVGKTTTSANIGSGLAAAGHKVVLVDTDIGLRNLDVLMGLENRIVYDLVDVTSGNCRLKQALIRDKRFANLFLLPAAQTKDKTAVNPEQMKVLAAELKAEFDYTIIDCPAGIEQGFYNAIAGADWAIVVCTPELSSVRDADRIIGLLKAAELRDPRLIINRIRPAMIKRGDMMNISDILDILDVVLIGAVPDNESIITSTNRGEPAVMDKNSIAGQAYRNITRRIEGEEIPIMNLDEPHGIMQKLKRLVGLR
ncbi:MAG TPA: septum site-determining protein MinD [Desulfosporosinus sp.]|nr:septum site-determining protein MinD [Desulfosporosinus sp.]